MLSGFLGLIFTALGFWGMIHWWSFFLMVLKGFLPVCLALSGLMAVVVGLSSAGTQHKKKK